MDGLPFDLLDYARITGTTNAGANTQMAAMPVNRFGHEGVRVMGLIGEALYIENAAPLAASIDVRSRVASAPFIAYVVDCDQGKIPTTP